MSHGFRKVKLGIMNQKSTIGWVSYRRNRHLYRFGLKVDRIAKVLKVL